MYSFAEGRVSDSEFERPLPVTSRTGKGASFAVPACTEFVCSSVCVRSRIIKVGHEKAGKGGAGRE